jgi:hypothetical protein
LSLPASIPTSTSMHFSIHYSPPTCATLYLDGKFRYQQTPYSQHHVLLEEDDDNEVHLAIHREIDLLAFIYGEYAVYSYTWSYSPKFWPTLACLSPGCYLELDACGFISSPL